MSAATTVALVAAAAFIVLAVVVLLLRRRTSAPASSPEAPAGLGDRVLVAVGRPRSSAGLAGVGAAMAAADHGRLLPITVVGADADADVRAVAERTRVDAERAAAEYGVPARGGERVDASVAEGVLHSVVEHDATLVVVGWPAAGGSEPVDGPVARIVADVPAPILIARLDLLRWSRVVLRLVEATSLPDHASVRLAVTTLMRLARAFDLPAVSAVPDAALPVPAGPAVTVVPGEGTPDPDDLTVVPVTPDLKQLRRAVAAVPASGDVVLALAYGPAAQARRALLRSAAALVDGSGPHDPRGE